MDAFETPEILIQTRVTKQEPQVPGTLSALIRQSPEAQASADPELNKKRYSLQYDISSGWTPKMQIAGPLPLIYLNKVVDNYIAEHLQSNNPAYKCIYLGWRPANTFQVHEQFCENNTKYPFYHFLLYKSNFLANFFKKYYSQYEFAIPANLARPFIGSNPYTQSELTFDSNFESGNLDAVFVRARGDYDLLIRPDTNTMGHFCNYYFKVKCKNPGTYRFNILNLARKRTLYERGMKPYIQSSPKKPFQQSGTVIRFCPRELKYTDTKTNEFVRMETYNLTFQYQFKHAGQEISVCYSIPYTYSMMLKDIQQWQNDCMRRNKKVFHRGRFSFSFTGVEIPLLTITNPYLGEDPSNKACIVVTARIHPGEANSSYLLKGLVEYLISDAADQLREMFVFKIVPMMNPDGVIMGNHRTGVSGKDLNRTFHTTNRTIFPQVTSLKDFMEETKAKYGNRLVGYFDFHGHSTRKNSFVYGPEHSIFDSNYSKCRQLPKMIAKKTDMFRYYSCKFAVGADKERAARNIFSKYNLEYCYTLEASNDGYFDYTTRMQSKFDHVKWTEVGKKVGEAIWQLSYDLLMKTNSKVKELQPNAENIVVKNDKQQQDSQSPTKVQASEKRLKKFKGQIGAINLKRDNKSDKVDADSSMLSMEMDNIHPRSSRFGSSRNDPNQEDIAPDRWENESDRFSDVGADSEPEDGNDLPVSVLQSMHSRIKENMEKYNKEILKIKEQPKYQIRLEKKQTASIKQAAWSPISSALLDLYDPQPSTTLSNTDASSPTHVRKPSVVSSTPESNKQFKVQVVKRNRRKDYAATAQLNQINIQVPQQPVAAILSKDDQDDSPENHRTNADDYRSSLRADYRRRLESNGAKGANTDQNYLITKAPQFIRIDESTFERLVQNRDFDLVVSRQSRPLIDPGSSSCRTNTKMMSTMTGGFSSRISTLGTNGQNINNCFFSVGSRSQQKQQGNRAVLTRKKSIKSLQSKKQQQRKTFDTISRVLTKSLPKIVLVKK